MRKGLVSFSRLPDFSLWDKCGDRRIPLSFSIEVTARCNNNCRHCCINLPPGDDAAKGDELTLEQISRIADQAVSLGSLWCLITGGEPLLRQDFFELYLALKRKGLLVSVFTNACLVTERHIKLFNAYPPRDMEVTIYGVTKETYERITRVPGSYTAFRRGLALLLDGGVRVNLKAMALRSNLDELPEIARFCRERTRDLFRFDPILNLRFDGNNDRNREIISERLSAEEVIGIEQADPERAAALKRRCGMNPIAEPAATEHHHLFQCNTGCESFAVSCNGLFRLCPALWQPDCLYNLRRGTLAEAWVDFVPRVRATITTSSSFIENCLVCTLMDFCSWCPGHAYLECGRMDEWCDYFCRLTRLRTETFGSGKRVVPNEM